MNKLILIFFGFISLVQAEDISPQFNSTKEIIQLVDKLSETTPSEYVIKVDDIRGKLEKYIEHKKRVCDGDFSTVILSKGENESDLKKSVKLSKEEREVCFRELKQVQQKYIESLFNAKKSYMIHLHSLRLKELEESKEMALKNLMNSFNKKGRR